LKKIMIVWKNCTKPFSWSVFSSSHSIALFSVSLHLQLKQGAWWFQQRLFSPVSPQIETLTWWFGHCAFNNPNQVTFFPFYCVINLIYILCLIECLSTKVTVLQFRLWIIRVNFWIVNCKIPKDHSNKLFKAF